MARSFRFLEHVALADSAFEARGDSVSELFVASAHALIEVMVDPVTVSTNWKRDLTLTQPQVSDLLFEWLLAIVFLKDAEAVIFHEAQAKVWQDEDQQSWQLQGLLIGDAIDPSRQELGADVKAVTKHLFEVKEESGWWIARVVLDI